MVKKMVMVLLIAAVVTGSVFAQMSAGIGGNFSSIMASGDNYEPDPVTGGGFFAFFDANYVMVKAGLLIAKDKDADDAANYLSLGLLGKYPIDLGSFTLFPMVGLEYNMFLSMGDGKREDLKDADFLDMILLQLGVGADFNITDSIYIRPTLLWGIDLHANDYEKEIDGLFKHKLDIGIAIGFKF